MVNTINMKILCNIETNFDQFLKLYSQIKGSEFKVLLVLLSDRYNESYLTGFDFNLTEGTAKGIPIVS